MISLAKGDGAMSESEVEAGLNGMNRFAVPLFGFPRIALSVTEVKCRLRADECARRSNLATDSAIKREWSEPSVERHYLARCIAREKKPGSLSNSFGGGACAAEAEPRPNYR